jgi:hypothetical protein
MPGPGRPKGVLTGHGKRAGLPFRDDLPTVGVSALRAAGKITLESTSIVVKFAEGLWREIAVTHRLFPQGGSWSFFLCPCCGRRVRTLRLYDGRPVCGRCDGLIYRCQIGDKTGVIKRLTDRLYGGGKVTSRYRTEARLRRTLIAERRKWLAR